MKKALAIIATLSLSGCTYGEIYARHESHPLVGKPLEGSKNPDGTYREGQVNAIGIELGRDIGSRVTFSQSVSYDFAAGCEACAFGGPWLYEARFSVRLFGEPRR